MLVEKRFGPRPTIKRPEGIELQPECEPTIHRKVPPFTMSVDTPVAADIAPVTMASERPPTPGESLKESNETTPQLA